MAGHGRAKRCPRRHAPAVAVLVAVTRGRPTDRRVAVVAVLGADEAVAVEVIVARDPSAVVVDAVVRDLRRAGVHGRRGVVAVAASVDVAGHRWANSDGLSCAPAVRVLVAVARGRPTDRRVAVVAVLGADEAVAVEVIVARDPSAVVVDAVVRDLRRAGVHGRRGVVAVAASVDVSHHVGASKRRGVRSPRIAVRVAVSGGGLPDRSVGVVAVARGGHAVAVRVEARLAVVQFRDAGGVERVHHGHHDVGRTIPVHVAHREADAEAPRDARVDHDGRRGHEASALDQVSVHPASAIAVAWGGDEQVDGTIPIEVAGTGHELAKPMIRAFARKREDGGRVQP